MESVKQKTKSYIQLQLNQRPDIAHMINSLVLIVIIARSILLKSEIKSILKQLMTFQIIIINFIFQGKYINSFNTPIFNIYFFEPVSDCCKPPFEVEVLGDSMSQVVGLPNNSYKPIINMACVRTRLCKLQIRVHSTRSCK